MTYDNDILSKFKLLNESTTSESSSSKVKNETTLDIFDDFLGYSDDGDEDLFTSFFKKVVGNQEKKYKELSNLYEKIEQEADKGENLHKNTEHKAKKQNFLQKAINKLFNKTQNEISQQAGKFVNIEDTKDSSKKNSSFSSFNESYNSKSAFISDLTGVELEERHELNRIMNMASYKSSLMSKVAKISINYNTDKMEDIIKSEELTDNELFELFKNYVVKSAQETPESKKVLEDILADSEISEEIVNVSNQNLDRTELEKLFIDFIKETSKDNKGGPLAITKASEHASQVVIQFAAAVNPEYMTRDELQELFVRYCRELSINDSDAFKELSVILSSNLGIAFTPDDGTAMKNDQMVEIFRGAISPENLTREDLEELFIRYIRELSTNAPDAFAQMESLLGNAIAHAFSPDTTMDDASRIAIAGFAQAIKPEYMTRDTLEELFVRYSREVSVKFPAAWAELQGMLSVAIGQAFMPDNTMDSDSRSAISGFAQAIKPEYMTRDQLEEVFTRFSRMVSIAFPAAWAELQGMLSVAVAQSFTPDTTMDDASRSAISTFEVTINPGSMKREEMEELFIRFVRQVSVEYPMAMNMLSGILAQALPNAYIEPIPDMDDYSVNVISSFESVIKPDIMTQDQLESIFAKYISQISVKFPSAHQMIRGLLDSALANAFEPDTTMDDSSRSAIMGFSQAIKPEVMTRESIEELFVRFSREISVKFPAAWSVMAGMLSQALGQAFVPDTTMDDSSRSAIAGFSQAIKPEFMTRETLEELFLRFSREISVKFPAAWAELEGMLNQAISNAYTPDTTMDDSSRTAIAGFSQAIKPEFMTRDQLEEVFVRFSREISVKFPAAWAELEGILNQALPNAYAPDTTMDDDSRSAIAGFSQTIKPEVMARDQLEEIFVRFSRQISIKFPAAWGEMQGMLSLAVANAFVPDTTMDDSSRSAIAGFSQTIKPEYMTRDELEEFFIRFSREISIKFPAAWAELEGMLNQALPSALVIDTTMDDSSRSAIACFAQAIKPDVMTREDLETMFLRFTREISIKFPAAWAELQGVLNTALPHAFVPDTTMDNATRDLIGEFESTITSGEFTEKQLESIFADYMRQVPLMFPVVKSIIENTARNKRGEAESIDKVKDNEEKDYYKLQKDFVKISDMSQELNLKAQDITKDLKAATNKDEIIKHQDKLRKIQGEKSSLDKEYNVSKTDIDSNIKATNLINDDFTQKLDLSFEKKDDRQLFEIDTEKLTRWDMLRMLRREEVLNTMYDMPKEDLVECLYVVPKYLLKQALTQLPVEDMCRVLFNARFPEALLRDMPRNKAIELLPSADQMLPILMMMGHISGFKNGCDLIEDVMSKSLKVDAEQNPTRSEEEILPFVMEQLIGKTPRNADAVNPVQGKQSPIQAAISDIESDTDSFDQIAGNAATNDKIMKQGNDKSDIKSEEELIQKYASEHKSSIYDIEPTKGNRSDMNASISDIDADQEALKTAYKKEKVDENKGLELKYRRPESLQNEQLQQLAQETMKNFSDEDRTNTLGAKRGVPAQMLEFLESMKKVKDLAGAKMAVDVLSVSQQKAIAKATLPLLETKHLVKITQNYGMGKKDMVKQMPRYAIEGLIKALPKHFMIQGFKLLDKQMVIGMLQTQSSQTIARVAAESLSRETVKDVAFKKQGFV